MKDIDINKLEKKVKSLKTKIKSKCPIIYIILALLILYISFFGGAFLSESKTVEKLNLFTKWFGNKDVEIDFAPFPSILESKTLIPFHVKNVGDKDIEEIDIFYTFCGLTEKKAILNKNRLYRDEELSFEIETPIILNTSCQVYTNKIWVNIYEDSQKNCYLDVPDDITENYCSFCKVRFTIYLDGKEIKRELWYPYLGDSINSGDFMRLLLVHYPLKISWKQGYSSECKVLIPGSSKKGLEKREPIGLGFFDTYTMCERGEEVAWCKENYYNK